MGGAVRDNNRLEMRLSLTLKSDKKVLVNWDNVTNIIPTATAYGDDYTEIYFVGGGSVGVNEKLEDIDLILAAHENNKKR